MTLKGLQWPLGVISFFYIVPYRMERQRLPERVIRRFRHVLSI